MLTSTLRPPPNRDFMQGYPGISGRDTRPEAHFAGTVTVTNVSKGMTVSWIHIELAKIESLPSNKAWTEFIGTEPISVWHAADGEGANDTYLPLDRTTFDFAIPIPRNLPPSMMIDKRSGIRYCLVATMAAQVRRGIFRKVDVPVTAEASCFVTLPKFEMLSSWPMLNLPEEYEAQARSFRMKIMKNRIYFAVGEPIALRAIVHSHTNVPRKVKNIKVSLLQTLITSEGGGQSSKEVVLATKSHSIRKKLANDEVGMYDLSVIVPKRRTLMDVSAAEHIEVYHNIIVELATEVEKLVIDKVLVRITPFTETASAAIMGRIGPEDELYSAGGTEAVRDSEPVFVDSSAGANQLPVDQLSTMSPTSPRVPRVFQDQTNAVDAVDVTESHVPDLPVRNQFMAPVSSGAFDLPGAMRPGEVVRLERDTSFMRRPASTMEFANSTPTPGYYRQSLPPQLFASETEKQRLFDNARSEARAYQAQFEGNTEFAEDLEPAEATARTVPPATSPTTGASQRFSTAADEKAALYNRAQQEVRSYYEPPAEAATPASAAPAAPAETGRFPTAAEEKTALYNRAQQEVRSYYEPPTASAAAPIVTDPVTETTTMPTAPAKPAESEAAPTYTRAESSRFPTATEEKAAIYDRAQDEVRAYYARQLDEDTAAQRAEVRPIDVQIVETQLPVAQSAEVEQAADAGQAEEAPVPAPPIMAVTGL